MRAAPHNNPNLRVLDPLPHADTLDLIGSAVAVVNISRFEGMPNVFLEAWARGVPVLALEADPDGVVGRHGLGVAAEGSWERFLAGASSCGRVGPSATSFLGGRAPMSQNVHSYESVGGRWRELIEKIIGAPSSIADWQREDARGPRVSARFDVGSSWRRSPICSVRQRCLLARTCCTQLEGRSTKAGT